jgi:nucleoside-diphosphate-sugar epimerase
MYIDDVVGGYLAVRDRGLKGEAYNIGGSGFQNIFDTVDIILEEMETGIRPKIIEKDFIEIKEQYLDSSKLEDLGWECNYDIRKGVRATIPWYREYHEDPKKFYWAT